MSELSLTTSSSTKYNVVGGSTSYSNLSSPFEAIGLAFKCGGRVVESDSGQVIFESGASKYYMFQFTNFYGATTSLSEANSWTENYDYAHVIDGKTGKYLGSSSTVLRGSLFRTETNSGGYFYNFSHNKWGYQSIQTTVSLSQAKVAFSSKNRADNAYIFLAAISSDGNEVIEAGLIFDQYARNEGVWKAYYKPGSGGIKAVKSVTKTSRSGNQYIANDDIVIKMSLRSGASGVYYEIKSTSGANLTSGYVDGISNSLIRSGQNVRFLAAVSFVPDFGYENNKYSLQDLRDGAYFRNVVLESYLYSGLNQTGTVHGFTGTSDPPEYSYIYDNDTIDYTRSGNKDIIDIYYDKAYTR